MTDKPWFQTLREDAEAMLRSAELIGDGDWTPQDVLGVKCAHHVLALVRITEAAQACVVVTEDEDGTKWASARPAGIPALEKALRAAEDSLGGH